MPSLKSKLVNFLLRNRHVLRGKAKPKAFDFNTSIAEFRAKTEKNAARYWKIPAEITTKTQTIADLNAEWLTPPEADLQKIILYIHGGGYVSGSCHSHRGFAATLAKNTGLSTLVYEYRLAPEHPYPAALEDSVTIYQWLLTSSLDSKNIIVVGESAGGGLALALLLALKARKVALPVAAVAISPWTDLTCSSDSYQTKNKVSLAPLNSWYVFSKYYVGNHSATAPFISPLYGNLKGLPPLFINSGMDDELYEDGEKFYLKAKEAGVDVTFRGGVGMVHCYPLFAPMFKEATQAMAEIIHFIRHHLKTNSSN